MNQKTFRAVKIERWDAGMAGVCVFKLENPQLYGRANGRIEIIIGEHAATLIPSEARKMATHILNMTETLDHRGK